ncbi:MAG: hypothetical protein ACN2B6_01295 [Rickettsiales bacterium]
MATLVTDGGSESQTMVLSPLAAAASTVSYQTETLTLGSGDTATSTILGTTVTQANTWMLVSCSGGGPAVGQANVRVTLSSDGTTVTATRPASGSSVTVEVILFEDTRINAQYFEPNVSTGTNSQTITSVDTNYAFIQPYGVSATGSTRAGDDTVSIEITSATNVDVAIQSNSADVSYAVIELDSDLLNSVQLVEVTQSAATVNTAITSVDLTKTILISTAFYNSSTILQNQDMPIFELTTATNLQARSNTANANLNSFVYIVEFNNGTITRGTDSPTGTTSTEVLGSAPGSGGAVIQGVTARYGGANDTDDDSLENMFSASLSGSTWTFTRGASTTTGEISYAVWDFDEVFAATDPILVLPDLGASKSRALDPSVFILANIEVSPNAARSISSALSPAIVLGSPIDVLPSTPRSASNSLNPFISISAQVDVNAITVSSGSRSLTPGISIASSVDVIPSTPRSLSNSLNPSVVLVSSVSVNATISRSSSNAVGPSILLASDVTVLPGAASSKSNALNPNIAIGAGVFVFGDTGSSTSSSLDPSILIAGQVDVQAETGSSSSISLDPIISIASQIQVFADLARSSAASNDPTVDVDETVVVLPLAPRTISSALRPVISVGQVVRIDQFTINYRQDDIVCAYADSIAIAKYEE